MKNYRALISIPIQAQSDDSAVAVANEKAASLRGPGDVVIGHVELVGEVGTEQLMEMSRTVTADPQFLRQLPRDWK